MERVRVGLVSFGVVVNDVTHGADGSNLACAAEGHMVFFGLS